MPNKITKKENKNTLKLKLRGCISYNIALVPKKKTALISNWISITTIESFQ